MSLSEYRKIISRLHVIIRVVTLTAQLSCRYQSIVTLSTVSISLSSIVKVSEVFMPLSEYRHIISNLHSIIRLSSHYQLTPYHYQSIAVLSEVYMPLSEYRHIIRILHTIIRKSSHYQQTVWHFQNIVTLSAGFHDVIRVSSFIRSVSVSLSEYRHIISRLYLIIRISKHYQQTPRHYQSIDTLSA